MTSVQKILFTIVFTVYGLVFYVLFYHLIAWYDPALLIIPDTLDPDYLGAASAFFLLIVVLAYLGASYIVLGRLREPSVDEDLRRPRRRAPAERSRPEPASERSFARQAGVQRDTRDGSAPARKTAARRRRSAGSQGQGRRRGRPPS